MIEKINLKGIYEIWGEGRSQKIKARNSETVVAYAKKEGTIERTETKRETRLKSALLGAYTFKISKQMSIGEMSTPPLRNASHLSEGHPHHWKTTRHVPFKGSSERSK